jgi:hypothetical protein
VLAWADFLSSWPELLEGVEALAARDERFRIAPVRDLPVHEHGEQFSRLRVASGTWCNRVSSVVLGFGAAGA